MKKKSTKIRNLEKNRYSIITDDLTTCFICGMTKEALHEVFYGNNRVNSMIYGCVIPLCTHCHTKIHNDLVLDLRMKRLLERAFLDVYECDIDYFRKIFYINYL